jgi:uncharacterized repeat protein (TIGR01451 family)
MRRQSNRSRKARRIAALLTAAIVASFVAVVFTALPSSAATISSAGPLTNVTISTDLNCAVNHTGDTEGEFFGDTACGTLVAVGSTLYGPANIPAGGSATPRTPWTPVSQTAVTGNGSSGSPFKIVTVVTGGTALRVTETDTYVVGEESYRTDVQVQNTGTSSASIILYRAGDCFLQNSDVGFGRFDSATGAIACVNVVNGQPGPRIEQWFPLSSGSHYTENFYSTVWGQIGARQQFPDQCGMCSQAVDNGAGLSWSSTLAAGASITRSHLTTFSPVGNAPLSTTKTADASSASPGATDGYTITIHNPNAQDVTLNSITDTLPAGFSYVAGSTTGATTSNPTVNGQNLTWAGPINAPHGTDATLHFQVHVASTNGTYFNNAGGDANGAFTVAPTGDTAPITIGGGPPVDNTAPSCTLSRIVTGPPKGLRVRVQDTGSGLASIEVTNHTNATTHVPTFTQGSTSALTVAATKINQTLPSQLALQVKDVAGNTTNCDPLIATLSSSHPSAGAADLEPAEHLVRITNGSPGVDTVTVNANGRQFVVALGAGEVRTLDIAAALHAGADNRVRATVSGGSGSADVLVWDGR